MKPGATIEAANADLGRMLPAWLNGWPGGSTQFYESMRITPDIRPLKQDVVGGVSDSGRDSGRVRERDAYGRRSAELGSDHGRGTSAAP